MKRRAILALAVFLAVFMVFGVGFSPISFTTIDMASSAEIVNNTYTASEAVIWTDKPDYEPGEIVTIFGSGFNPDSSIEVNVTRPDDTIDTEYTTSNDSGAFVCYYDLDGILGIYDVIASDGVNIATTEFTDAQLDWEQGRNDLNPHDEVVDTLVTWSTGSLNHQNSLVTEGNIIPPYPSNIPGHVNYRAIIEGLPSGTYVLTIQYDFAKSGKLAFDFLTTNYGISDANLGVENMVLDAYPFPYDTYSLPAPLGGGAVEDRQSVHDSIFLSDPYPRMMKLYNATIISITEPVHVGDISGLNVATIEIAFHKSSSESYPIVAAWGGHLGIGTNTPEGYGTDNGASSISGAPFHMTFGGLLNVSSGKTIIKGGRDLSIQPGAVIPPSRISGYKWHDLNGNGAWDGRGELDGEPALPGWEITLEYPDEVTKSTTTDENGYYIFEGLLAGTYTLTETLQDGWVATHSPDPVTVATGEHSTENNFGNFYGFKVTGYKWDDLDGDGYWDQPEEPGINGWTIYLYKGDLFGTPDTCITATNGDLDGYYEFTITERASYYIREALETGWTKTYPLPQEVGPGPAGISAEGYDFEDFDALLANPDGHDFGNFKWMNITGHKLDYDSGDGLNNWKIRLYNSTGHLVDET
ncbi:MAG: SdrD B-like domain-containing protein, partial [Candidatus Thorarchaeota archaeon]